MKRRWLLLALVFSSFFGYLAWGNGQHMFLIKGEWDIIQQTFRDPMSTLHPFIWLPLIGQVLLVVAAFRKTPSRLLTWIGVSGTGLLFGLMTFIGIIEAHWGIGLSTLPFWIMAVLSLREVSRESRAPEAVMDGD